MKRKVHSDSVNYLKYDTKRKTLAHYLKAGGFKKIGGAKIHGNHTDRSLSDLDDQKAISS
ncbi:MAG: hypothetical protein NT118_10400 [Lentisphaerae bacterium]|nr:hypothetical protein [Lentisphaerota bacterium]